MVAGFAICLIIRFIWYDMDPFGKVSTIFARLSGAFFKNLKFPKSVINLKLIAWFSGLILQE